MAGRKKAGVAQGPAEELSKFLRRLRRRPDGSELTYAEMADRLGGRRFCSAPTLSRSDQGGDRLPRIETVDGYARACGATPAEIQHARRLLTTAQRNQKRARTAAEYADPGQGLRAARRRYPAIAPHPDYMRTPLDFQHGLRAYRRETGGLSVRAIAENAELSGLPITKSTVQRMLTHGTFPQWQQVEALLTGCRPGKLPDLEPWHRAWRRIFGPTTARNPQTHWETVRELLSGLVHQSPSDRLFLYDHFTRSMPARASEVVVKPAVDHQQDKLLRTLWDLANVSRARPGGP
ncbi:hypothetical protein ADK60_37425 [Streptomyces sp. XY431]|uniref:helix-turn-helix domain-containing protein n=1 Tax=Streptomycetaceae TaxID=2062 RepID=UPI0006B02846|nr:helix-turn-helix transcriptional regulator [Streptomyces sp. XY431]KOV10721.1 hypothetical protein ADK60_37425 [Streptomyces sp. XY431]